MPQLNTTLRKAVKTLSSRVVIGQRYDWCLCLQKYKCKADG